MDEQRRYEAEALMADLTSYRRTIHGLEDQVELRLRDLFYPDVVAVLVREQTRTDMAKNQENREEEDHVGHDHCIS